MKNYIQNPTQKVVITFDKNTTLARIYEDNKVVAKGTAVCCSEDEFDIKAGSELALTRALEAMKTKPEEWVKVERPPRVGDYIRIIKVDNKFDEVGDILKVDALGNQHPNWVQVKISNHPKFKKYIDKVTGGWWRYNDWLYQDHLFEVVEPAPKKTEKPEEPKYRKITRTPKKGDYVRVIKSLYSFDKPDRYIELDTVALDCNGKLKGFSVAYGKHPGAIEDDCDWEFGWHYYMGSTVAEFYEKV